MIGRLSFFAPLALTLALFVGEARAECAAAYTPEQMSADIMKMNAALRGFDDTTLRTVGPRMEKNLPCVRSPLPPTVFAAAYRLIGVSRHFAGDEAGARTWFRTALELDATFEWDVSELDVSHPMWGVFEQERAATSVPEPVAGKVLAPVAGSIVYLDGKLLKKPAATLDRPHLLQVVAESDKSVRRAEIIQGNAIPEDLLQAEAAPELVAAPSETKKKNAQPGTARSPVKSSANPDDPYGVVRIDRVRPKAKTPMMVGGGVVALGAGGVYALSFLSAADFEKARTTAELEQYQRKTNTLVVASAATLVAGMGIGYAGIMMGGGPGGLWLRTEF